MENNIYPRAERNDEWSSRSTVQVRATKIFTLLLVILVSFTIVAPRPASAWQTDIPLDQALVLAGGETTNPRQYDPHTTYGSGDKRIFSGLVSLDPQLNLTRDLAERWDVIADGKTYT